MKPQEPVRLRLRRRICAAIADGLWPPGSRLPGRDQLALDYGVSLRSLQQTVDELVSDGHLVSHGGHGTMVAEHPPCCELVGLYLPADCGPGLATNLRLTAEHWPGPLRFQMRSHHEIEHLATELQDYRMHGAIILGEVQHLDQSVQRCLRQFPVVIIGFMSERFPRLHLDLFASIRWGLEHLINTGKQRVGIVTSARSSPMLQQRLQGYHGELSSPWDPRLVLEIPLESTHIVDNLLPLWWSLPAGQRPDAILISDDHLVPPVSQALAKLLSNTAPPALLAHANIPAMSPCALPAERYGFRSQDILGNACDLLRQAANEPAPIRTLLPTLLSQG
ncbi:MAG: GntR family transcriptional regulator [Planctomycetota bacterium]|nr:MAG: GntR family transcriptional regulator [Planctomycetota bacterium]